MNKKTKGLLLVATLGSLFTFTSCGEEKPSSSQGPDHSLPEKVYYVITLTNGDGYTISPLEGYNPSKVEGGRDFKFTISAKEGYTVSRVKVGSSDFSLLPDDNGVYTLSGVSENTTISAETRIRSYRITFQGENFTLLPLEGYDAENVNYGKDFKFKLDIASHNTLKEVTLNGASLSKDASGVYTISNVTSSMSVSISTEEDTYALSFQEGTGYSFELADATSDLTKIPYSKGVRFKVNAAKSYRIDVVKVGDTVLTKDEDGYYMVKNQEGSVQISVNVSFVTSILSFDSNGGSIVPNQTVPYDTLATLPENPTRAGDDYFASYSFDGWYTKTGKFDFAKTVTEDTSLMAKWKGVGQKYEEVKLAVGSSSNITTTDSSKAITVRNLSGAFDQIAWKDGVVDQAKKAELIAAFGGETRANDGVFVSPYQPSTGTIETQNVALPKIDFKSMLGGGKVMTMEMGCYQDGAAVSIDGKTVFENSGAKLDYLTRANIYFYLEGETVKLRAVGLTDPGTANVYGCKEISYALTDEQANGTSSLEIGLATNLYNRHYWFGHPRIAKGEYNLLDLASKQNVTIENGVLKTRAERDLESGAPFTQWKETCALSFDGVGALGNASKPLAVNYGKIDFNSLFAEGKGARFTLGSWNGQEKLTFGDLSFGVSGVKPQNPTANTTDSLIDTWTNFQVEITRLGMRVLNHYEDKEYLVPLSNEVLSGEKTLTFDLGTQSNNHFFYISNVKAFHA